MKQLMIASGNKGKIKEFRDMFEPYGIEVRSLADYEGQLPDVEETGDTFFENARLKAETICELVQTPVLADDSGLSIDALNGAPGVYSARYAGEPTNDVNNYEKVLQELVDVSEEERHAKFICVLAIARPGKETVYFEGNCPGKITFAPEGDNGFGYDPIFIPEGYKQTMAQLEAVEKNSISHRHHALEKLNIWFASNDI